MARCRWPFKFILTVVFINNQYSLISSNEPTSDLGNEGSIPASRVISHPGHLKPFGSAGPFEQTDEIDGYPSPSDFFPYHVFVRRPLKMIGAGRLSPAFSLWTDEYLLSLDSKIDSEEHRVLVEMAKKENRTGQTEDLEFKEFIKRYRQDQIYMVDNVPIFLRKDVVLPMALQCEDIYKGIIVEMIMWMSSGGTSSVIHTDAVDNIICVLDGEKTLVLVDPDKYRSGVYLDHPEGAYSGIDVDSVNFTHYPEMANVKYHAVNLSAGDCLYIPYKWIHQVRSFNRNIAINVWWNHHWSFDVDLAKCAEEERLVVTLDKVNMQGFAPITDDVDALKDHFSDYIRRDLNLKEFFAEFGGEIKNRDPALQDECKLPLKQIFLVIDKDEDKMVTTQELSQLTDKDWEVIRTQMIRYDTILDNHDRNEEEQRILEERQNSYRRAEL